MDKGLRALAEADISDAHHDMSERLHLAYKRYCPYNLKCTIAALLEH